MDGACDLHGKGQKCIQWVRPQERDHLRDFGVDGSTILKMM